MPGGWIEAKVIRGETDSSSFAARPRLRATATFLRRLGVKAAKDKVSASAAAVAFFSLLAAFPGLGIVISLYGLIVNAPVIERHLALAAGLLPESVVKLLAADLAKFTQFQRHHFGLSLVISLVLTVTSGHAALATLTAALNTIYGRAENRHAFHQLGVRLILTLATLLFVALSFALVALLPLFAKSVSLSSEWRHAIEWARWPVLALMMIGAVARLYRHAPHHKRRLASWRNSGAWVATLLWLVFSLAYSFYVGQIGAYDIVYGSVSAAITLLIWLYLSSIAVLLGAEIDALRG